MAYARRALVSQGFSLRRLPCWAALLSLGLASASRPSHCHSADTKADTERVMVWPDLAPGETERGTGERQPNRPDEQPPVTRVTQIRRPSIDVYLPERPNGTAILVLPGGGFGKVVPDKEGSEAAPWLNRLGAAVFVLRYRTNEATPQGEPAYLRPLQDSQRALRLIRSSAKRWGVDPQRVGVLGFSAGGQVASVLHTRGGKADYEPLDEIDRQNCQPDFSLLIYPWNVLAPTEPKAAPRLLDAIRIDGDSPPAFLVHTHDDRSSSLGSVLIYSQLKQHGVEAELHVYRNGGHGYGMRPVAGSDIGTWPDRATAWLVGRGMATPPSGSQR
ncbi:MAG: alpha/beta hydrolase [Planctomycetales bacterium]|nr:alpha/beta hydrolase [Planctomycetales bacterium]